jgi:hypothetical protein
MAVQSLKKHRHLKNCATVGTIMSGKVVSISTVRRVPKAPQASRGNSLLYMTLPDAETLRFWRLTADSPREFADRIAQFSRRMQELK